MSKKNAKGSDKNGANAVAGAAAMGGMGDKARQLKEFFEESKVELKKVTWPSRKETITTGIAVVVLVIVFSLFLGIVDLGLSKVVKLILS